MTFKPFQKRLPLKLDIQFFAEGDVPTGSAEPQNPQPPAEPNNQANEPKEGDEPKNPDNQLNEDDIKRLHESEMLKSLGVTDFNQLKQSLEKFREIEDSQKTEAQKQKEQMETLEKNFNNTKEENSLLQAKLAAYDSGVTGKNADAVITLAKARVGDGLDINAAIKQVVEEYPHFAEVVEEGKKNPQFVTDKHNKLDQTKEDAFLNAFK